MSLVASVEHAFAIAIGDIKKAGAVVIKDVLPELVAVHTAASTIESITALVSPQLANIERVGDAVLGKVIAAIEDADAAALAKGLNVTLDAQTISDIKSIIPAIKAQAAPQLAAVPTGGTPAAG
jgi:hypothetical protein